MKIRKRPTRYLSTPGARGRAFRGRRGGALLWSVAALALAVALSPMYVSLCHSLARQSARGAHRLVATQRGSAELERLRGGSVLGAEFAVADLPSGRGKVTFSPGPSAGLRQADLSITWDEDGVTARAEWTTLVPAQHQEARR